MGKESNILNPSMPGKTVGSYIWGIAVFVYSCIIYIYKWEKKQQPVLKNVWFTYIN